MIQRNAQPLLTQEPYKRVLVSLAVALVLLLTILAGSPQAHERLHADAGQAEHECAVTMFSHAADTALVAVMLGVVIWRQVALIRGGGDVFVFTPEFRLLPGRAPPGR